MKIGGKKAIPAGSHIFLIFEKKLLQQGCRFSANFSRICRVQCVVSEVNF
jgi:hypothetical protein